MTESKQPYGVASWQARCYDAEDRLAAIERQVQTRGKHDILRKSARESQTLSRVSARLSNTNHRAVTGHPNTSSDDPSRSGYPSIPLVGVEGGRGMKRVHRHTIMDGRVVEFARDFTETDPERKGFPFPLPEAKGPFQVSASRNRVLVHRASIDNLHDLNDFLSAMQKAWEEHKYLSQHDGRPEDGIESGDIVSV